MKSRGKGLIVTTAPRTRILDCDFTLIKERVLSGDNVHQKYRDVVDASRTLFVVHY